MHGTLHIPNVQRVMGNESRGTEKKETLGADVINSLSDKRLKTVDMNSQYRLTYCIMTIPSDWSHCFALPEGNSSQG